MKLFPPPVAVLLITMAMTGGCKQVEGFLRGAETSSSENRATPASGGMSGPTLPSNPIPRVASVTTGALQLPPDARADEVDDAHWRPPVNPPDRHYTAHNMWYEQPDSVDAINYKTGRVLPAGTEVAGVVVIKRRFRRDTIEFTTPADGVAFSIVWDSKNHAGWTLDEIRQRMISRQTLEELTRGLRPLEIESIRTGSLQAGMSRRAVLIAYGYPPALSTPDLNSNLWKYWVTPSKFVSVRFDRDHRTVAGPAVKQSGR